jgi:hypothetical protein
MDLPATITGCLLLNVVRFPDAVNSVVGDGFEPSTFVFRPQHG